MSTKMAVALLVALCEVALTSQQAAAQQEVMTYNWVLEAYYQGSLVDSQPFTNQATSDTQAAVFVQNKLAVYGQQLNARRVKWNRLNARFVSKTGDLPTATLPEFRVTGSRIVKCAAASSAPTARAAREFSFTGSCTIKCANGRCENFCETSTVIAIDARDARFKAEVKLRQDASHKGTVVEGTVSVTVRF